MRPIRFRGKRLIDNKWVYGSLVQCLNGSVGIFNGGDFQYNTITAIKKSTVGQFTGLFDKNGKAIYEGDIIKIVEKFDDENVYTSNGVVCFEEGIYELQNGKHFAYLGWLMHNDDITKLEVIGNIHDNPELLKGGEQ